MKYDAFLKGVHSFAKLPEEYKTATKIYVRNYYKGRPLPENIRFLEYKIPTNILVNDLEKLVKEDGYKDFSTYHKNYVTSYNIKNYKEIWPIFLDDTFGCVIEDGITRFHDYVEQKIEFIPCIIMREINHVKR